MNLHSPNSTCNYNLNPSSNPIPFPPADNDICSSNPNCFHIPQLDLPDCINFPNSHDMCSEFDDIYLQFLDLFYQHQFNYYPNSDHLYNHNEITPTTPPNNMPLQNSNNAGVICRSNFTKVENPGTYKGKRACKKDRHSKINTVNGPRNRRMRLSHDVAQRFFRLQDLLGFNKASRTVDWLLRHSDSAIRHLADAADLKEGGEKSGSSTTEEAPAPATGEIPKLPLKRAKKRKVGRVARATVGRESRRKARERARERTSQKRRLMYESNRTEQPKLAFADSSAKEFVNDQQSWNSSTALYGYLPGNAGFEH